MVDKYCTRLRMKLLDILHHKKALAVIWISLILFPNPLVMPLDVYRLFEMPVQPSQDVRHVAESLPANGTLIEGYVNENVSYTYDFQSYGVVWYIPTPGDVLKSQQGDCKSRAILLASLLEAKGISHSVSISPVHFWVDYEGKPQTSFTAQYETADVAIVENGHVKTPQKATTLLYLNTYVDILWTSMPVLRKVLLISGLAAIAQGGHFTQAKKSVLRRLLKVLPKRVKLR
ncbi:MAG: hypothetical protein ACXVIV_05415 [Halobacteriota archaeon]